MTGKTAFIFPAFITDYTRKELDFLSKNNIDINDYVQKASEVINVDLPEFSYHNEIYKSDEFLSQIIAYLFSCAISDILKKKNIIPQIIAGYSMGIYAGLYAAGSITLEDGVRLIYKAFNIVREITTSRNYSMGALIGLTINDVKDLILKNKLNIEIININNEYSLVVAGAKNDIARLIECARNDGALSAMELTVNTPYHSSYLLKYSREFSEILDTIPIGKATIPIASTYNQRIFSSVQEIKKELVFNLTRKINWNKTMQEIIQLGYSKFYECGAGKDLKKIARFIKGDYKLLSIYKT